MVCAPAVSVAKTAAVSTSAAQARATTLDFSATTSGGWMCAISSMAATRRPCACIRTAALAATSRVALKKGDVVEYRFTSWGTARGVAVDSAAKTVVLK
jgi:hypothetical protein